MANGYLGVNVRTLGISRDQAMPVIRQLAPAFTLVHDDPELAALVQAAGLRVVYRQSGDESFDLAPAEFVRVRAANVAAPAYIHTHNEKGLTPALAQREIECMEAADAIGRKCCIINAATHQSAADWQTMRPAIEYAVTRGHICGVHVYLDGKLDQYAWEFVPLMQEYGGAWLLTEFAPIADVRDPFTGWRGFTSASAVGAWIRGITPTLKRLNLPACWFSLDHWQPNDYGREKGFGVYGIAEIIDSMVSANATAQWSNPMTQPTDKRTAIIKLDRGVNLRASVGTGGRWIATVPFGAEIEVWPQPVTNADGFEWVRAAWGANAGYIVRVYEGANTFTVTAPPPNEPALCSPFLTDEEHQQMITAITRAETASGELRAAFGELRQLWARALERKQAA